MRLGDENCTGVSRIGAAWPQTSNSSEAMVVSLHAEGGKLVLRQVDGIWWQLAVAIGAAEHVLGSDTRRVIVSRLQEGLCNTLGPTTSGSFDGIPSRWVVSLSEEPDSVYAGDCKGVRLLFFQDANGTYLGRLSLSSAEREAWLGQLAELQG